MDISADKSKITNLRKNYTEFLGFKLMVKSKSNRYVCQSRMCDKAKKSTINKLKQQVKKIQKRQNAKEVSRLNSMILGSHNYYNSATNVSMDFKEINFLVTKTLDNRLKGVMSDKPKLSETYKRLYGSYKGKIRTVQTVTIFPIYGCKTKPPMCFSQDTCNYTDEGRKSIHVKLKGYSRIIEHLLKNPSDVYSTELNDNRISLIAGQQCKCHVTKKTLEIGNMECHHKKPRIDGGTDEYKNLVWLNSGVHKLIHAVQDEIIYKYLNMITLNEKGLKRINSLRKLVGNSVI